MSDPLNVEVPTEGPYYQIVQEIAKRYNSLKAENDNLLEIIFEKGYDEIQKDESGDSNHREPSLMEATFMLVQDLSEVLKGNDDMESAQRSLNHVGKLLGKEEVDFDSKKVNSSISSDSSIEINRKYMDTTEVNGKTRWPISSPMSYNNNGRDMHTVSPDSRDGDDYGYEELYSDSTSLNISHESFDSDQSSWDDEGYHALMERLSEPKQKVVVKKSFAVRLLSELGMKEDECRSYLEMNSIGAHRCVLSIERLIHLSDILMKEREDYVDNVLDIMHTIKQSNNDQLVEYDEEDQASI